MNVFGTRPYIRRKESPGPGAPYKGASTVLFSHPSSYRYYAVILREPAVDVRFITSVSRCLSSTDMNKNLRHFWTISTKNFSCCSGTSIRRELVFKCLVMIMYALLYSWLYSYRILNNGSPLMEIQYNNFWRSSNAYMISRNGLNMFSSFPKSSTEGIVFANFVRGCLVGSLL